MLRHAAFAIVALISVSAFATTTEDSSKINGYAVLNDLAVQSSKINGYAVLNDLAVQASKINGYAILTQAMTTSKVNNFAVLCAFPATFGTCLAPRGLAGSMMLLGVGK